MRSLAGFIRENTIDPSKSDETGDKQKKSSEIAIDVQAAIYVMVNRDYKNDVFIGEYDDYDFRYDLSNSDVSPNANFSSAKLNDFNLSNSRFVNARFDKAELNRANMRDSELLGVDFRGCKLIRADFTGAILKDIECDEETDFSEANFDGADFSGTKTLTGNFKGADTNGMIVKGVNLAQVKNLKQQQVNTMVGDNKTVLPRSLTPPKEWKTRK